MPDELELYKEGDDEQETDVSLGSSSEETSDADSAGAPPVESDSVNGGREAADASHSEGQGGGQDRRSTWQEALQQAGFQSFDDVDKAVKALVESNRQRDDQIRQYADQLRFYQDQSRFREQNPQPQPHGQQAPAAQEPRDPIDELLSDWTDPAWANKYIEVDESGNRYIPDTVDDETRKKIMSVDRKLRQWQEMMGDPRRFAEAVDKRVERMIEERFDQSFTQRQAEQLESQTVQEFVNSNAHWLYQRDPATGQYIRDALTGQLVYSDLGAQFDRTMQDLNAEGVTNVAKQIEWARRSMAGLIPQGGPVVREAGRAATPEQIAQQRRAEMRGRRNTGSNTQRHFNGVTSPSGAGPTGENTLSFGEAAYAAMKQGA